METKFIDNVLISLKRQYSKDEAVQMVFKKLSQANVYIGKLHSEIQYLQNELNSKEENKEVNKLAKIEAKKNKLFEDKAKLCLKQKKQIDSLRDTRDTLIRRIVVLESENNKQ